MLDRALLSICRNAVGLLILAAADSASAGTPNARDVYAAVSRIMEPPIQYHLKSGKSVSRVFQIKNSQGAIVTRLDVSDPLAMTVIMVGKDRFEIFRELKLIIDTGHLSTIVGQQAGNDLRPIPDISGDNAMILKPIIRMNKKCLELSIASDPSVIALLKKTLPAQSHELLPIAQCVVVDAETYEPVEYYSMSPNGSAIGRATILGISRDGLDELPREFFLPPSGMRVVKPASIHEHAGIISGVLATHREKTASNHRRKAEEIIASFKPVGQLPRPQLDPQTGLLIAPVPSGMSQEQFRAQVEKAKREHLEKRRTGLPEVPAAGPSRLVGPLTIVNALVFIGLALAVYYRARVR